MSDRYSVPKLIERKIDRPFREFRDELRREYRRVLNWYKPDTVKDQDLKFSIDAYLRNLDIITYFLDTQVFESNPICDIKVSRIIKPAIIHYVDTKEIPDTCLKDFENQP
jgi:hypothetical protein